MFLRLIAIALLVTSCAANAKPREEMPAAEIPGNETYGEWLGNFKQKAVQRGIAPATIDTALANFKPEKKVINFDRKQPEAKQTLDEYLDNVINDARIQKGRRMMAENKTLLDDISKKTGVEPEFIVALWGLESGYGENTGNFSIVKALATLAYEGRRREFFESELINALQIIEQQHLQAEDLRGSWAGAMGQCQFMPSSYLNYGVDYDGDGHIDIWNDRADVLASIANYLSTVGWSKDEATKEKALMHWNHSSYFVASVFELAEAIK